MKISLDTRELDALSRELAKDSKEVHNAVRTAIIETAYKIDELAKIKIMRGTKTGYTYDWRGISKGLTPDSYRVVKGRVIPVKVRYKPHRASAKGEAPASDTGNLVNSFRVIEKSGLKAIWEARAKYSGFLEEELDRPYIQVSVDEASTFLTKELSKVIEEALK